MELLENGKVRRKLRPPWARCFSNLTINAVLSRDAARLSTVVQANGPLVTFKADADLVSKLLIRSRAGRRDDFSSGFLAMTPSFLRRALGFNVDNAGKVTLLHPSPLWNGHGAELVKAALQSCNAADLDVVRASLLAGEWSKVYEEHEKKEKAAKEKNAKAESAGRPMVKRARELLDAVEEQRAAEKRLRADDWRNQLAALVDAAGDVEAALPPVVPSSPPGSPVVPPPQMALSPVAPAVAVQTPSTKALGKRRMTAADAAAEQLELERGSKRARR